MTSLRPTPGRHLELELVGGNAVLCPAAFPVRLGPRLFLGRGRAVEVLPAMPAMFGPALVTPVPASRPPSRGVHSLGTGLAAAKKLALKWKDGLPTPKLELCGADRYSSATMQRRQAASVLGSFLFAQLGTKRGYNGKRAKAHLAQTPTDLHKTKHARQA